MGKVISITNQKGGVGKTTISFNLSKEMARLNYRVLAIDNDPQGNLTTSFLKNEDELTANIVDFYKKNAADVKPQEISKNLHLIGANLSLSKVSLSANSADELDGIFSLKDCIDLIKHNYDYVIIDCLPTIGHYNIAALAASDYAVIPVKPAFYSLEGLKDCIGTIRKMSARVNRELELLGIIINMVEGKNTNMGEGIEAILRKTYKNIIFENTITKGTIVEASPMESKSIFEADPKSKQSKQFELLTDEIIRRINAK